MEMAEAHFRLGEHRNVGKLSGLMEGPEPAYSSHDQDPTHRSRATVVGSERLPTWRWAAVVGLVVVTFFCAGLMIPNAWYWMGVYPMHPLFQDFAAVLAAAEAVETGIDPYIWAENPFETYGRPHGYGPWWFVLGSLGLTTADWWWTGIVVDVAFLIAALLVLNPRDRLSAWLSAVILVSPPVLLGLERANNDLVIFVLGVALLKVLPRGKWWGVMVGGAMVIAATLLKYYPIAVFPVLLMGRRGARTLWGFGSSVVGLVLMLFLFWGEITQSLNVIPAPDSPYSYGLKTPFNAWMVEYSHHGALIAGWILGVSASAIAFWWAWPRQRGIWVSTVLSPGYAIGALAWCACFALNTNFIYRYIWLIFPASRWISQLRHREWGRLGGVQLGMLGFIGFVWIPWIWIVRNTVDVNSIRVPIFWCITGVMQAVALMLTGMVAFHLVKGAISELRAWKDWYAETHKRAVKPS